MAAPQRRDEVAFGITVEFDGGPIILELTGPPGTREFIGALLEV